jgi:predicted dehydrogenase
MDAEDTAAIILRFDGGVVGELHLDCLQHGYSRSCTIVGADASARWEFGRGIQIMDANGRATDESLVPDVNAMYLAELESFLMRRFDGAATLADGRRVLDVVLAARRSAAARQEVAV